MKIGILTFQDTVNYGAELQALALRNTIQRISHRDTEVINYQNPKISVSMQIERFLGDKSIKGIYKRVFYVPYLRKKFDLFSDFASNHKLLSNKKYNHESITQADDEYDTIIFGSDQIWNLTLTNNDYNYFGVFSRNAKLISYAASFGKYDFNDASTTLVDSIRRFDFISLREEKDVIKLSSILKKPVLEVVDPTFLIDSIEWTKYEEAIEVPSNYILLYLVSPQKEELEFAQEVGKENNLPVIYITYSNKKAHGLVNLFQVSPANFLYLIHHATIVLTNSFHGTALSVNYNKPFYWMMSPQKGKANNRVLDLLSHLQLNKRVVTIGQTICLGDPVDWTIVNNYILTARKTSSDYLRRALN